MGGGSLSITFTGLFFDASLKQQTSLSSPLLTGGLTTMTTKQAELYLFITKNYKQ